MAGLLDLLQGNGGLLDFLQNNSAAAIRNNPGVLASDTANYGPAPMSLAPPQQAPIVPANQPNAIDSAAWPQGPVGAPMNANAASAPPSAPMAAPAPSPAAAPPSAPFSLGGVGDRLGMATRGLIGNLQNGPIGALAGGIGSLVTGKETDPSAIARQKLNANAQALINKGASQEEAAAAVNNPTLMSALVTKYYGPQTVQSLGNGYIADKNGKITRAYEPDDKFQHVMIKNPDGSETPQAFNPSTGSYSGTAPPAQGKFSVDPELTGPARLEALRKVDPNYARKIEAMVNGDFPMPTGVAALKPDSKRMIEDALSVSGDLSASDFATRAATRKDYASGIASRVTKSINTTIGHFATLNDAIDKLGNYSYFPHLANFVHDQYGSNLDPAYQKAKATFEANKEAAVKELDFALSGGHSSVSGSAELRDKFNRADSPEALHAAVTEAMSLLQKRLQSHTKAFNEGTKSQRDAQDFIYPENKQAFDRMLGQEGAPQGAPPGVGNTTKSGVSWSVGP